jgi:hypothetical protein
MRQGQDDDVMAVQCRRGRRLQNSISEIHQMWMMRLEPVTGTAVRGHRPDFELGMLQPRTRWRRPLPHADPRCMSMPS